MNPRDLFTWISAALLAGCAIVIFAFFAKDARKIFEGDRRDRDEDE